VVLGIFTVPVFQYLPCPQSEQHRQARPAGYAGLRAFKADQQPVLAFEPHSFTLGSGLVFGGVLIGYAGRLGLEIGDYLLSAVPFCLALSSTVCGLCWERPASGLSRYTTLPRFLEVCWNATRWWLILPLTVFFFTFVVPVAFLTTVPAEAMLGRVQLVW